MPDDNDTLSVSRDREFVVRWRDDDGRWVFELMTNRDFDKFQIGGEGYEWLEDAFETEVKS
jgi:hypothetical protein